MKLIYAHELEKEVKVKLSSFMEDLSVDYIEFYRVNKDQEIVVFSTFADYLSYYFENYSEEFPSSMTFQSLKNYDYIIWDFWDKSYSNILHTSQSEFNLYHWFTIIEKQQCFTDTFSFATRGYKENQNFFYFSNINKIISASFQMKQVLEEIINSFEKKTIKIEYKKPLLHSSETSFTKHAKNNEYRKIFIEQNIYFTQKETETCRYLLMGYSAKEISQAIGVSHKTVENHLKNLRSKTKSSTKSELCQNILNNNLLKYVFL